MVRTHACELSQIGMKHVAKNKKWKSSKGLNMHNDFLEFHSPYNVGTIQSFYVQFFQISFILGLFLFST